MKKSPSGKSRLTPLIVAGVLLLHAGMSACTPTTQQAQEADEYTVAASSSPFPIRRLEPTRVKWIGERHSIAWIDNERLLVAGYDPATRNLNEDFENVPPAGLYEWNVKTDELIFHSPLGKPWFCYSPEHMRYLAVVDGKLMLKEGGYGHEETKPFEPMGSVDWNTCKPRPPCLDGPRGGRLCELPAGRSYIALGRDRHNSITINPDPPNIWYYPTREHPGIELPIAYHDASWQSIHYSKSVQAYVIPQSYTVPGRSPPPNGRAWLLYVDGTVVEIKPPVDLPSGPTWFLPVHGGFISAAGSIVPTGRFTVGTAGAYFWADAGAIKVVQGLVDAIEVSPDGCLAAVKFNPWKGSYVETNLDVLDLCSKGR